MKKAFFILILLLHTTFGFAQHAINQTLIDYFDNLDKSQVPTGILVEQGFPMYDLEMYKGQVLTDSNKVDADLFGWLYMGLALGNVNDNTVIPEPLATYLLPISFKLLRTVKHGRLVSNSVATRFISCVSRRARSTASV